MPRWMNVEVDVCPVDEPARAALCSYIIQPFNTIFVHAGRTLSAHCEHVGHTLGAH